MLTELRIRNFAIIDSLTVPLAPGLNVLSGETGAGKSIIVGALGLLLGERASAELIRTGSDKAVIEGTFDLRGLADTVAALDEQGIDAEDDVLVLRREVSASGRTRAWINGSAVNASTLAAVGRRLIDLHGQHEAQTLIDPDEQRNIIDAFAGASPLAADVARAFADWQNVRREMADLTTRRADAERRADYLRHTVSEIDSAHLSEGDEVRLEEEARRLENAEELRGLLAGIAQALDGEETGALHMLGLVERQLGALQRIDPSLSRVQDLYDAAYYSLDALRRELDSYERDVDLDPERLEHVRRRRDTLFRLTKKYGPTVREVMEVAHAARAELDLVDSAELDLKELERHEQEARDRVDALSAALSVERRTAAVSLAAAVDRLLPGLGIPDGRFSARLVALPHATATGAESVEFCVALNVGHDSRPLARVASGGELSRIMLALKNILAQVDRIPTLIFDEVDAGIGGKVGTMVADALRRVSENHQVLAITHLPQIAARAHHHVLVSKEAPGGVTTADIKVLTGEERVAEVARMLGGDQESDASIAHARELLMGGPPTPARPATRASESQRRSRR
jgi:DNA repair protein RecN (Recombination protein N)